MIFDVFLGLSFSIGLTFGVGASTFALIYYIGTERDGVVTDAERRFSYIIYVLIRVGIAILVLATLLKIATAVLPLSQTLLIQGFLICVITVNAILMTYRIISMKFGPIIAGGSWYTLFFVTQLAPVDVNPLVLFEYYILFLTVFYFVHSFFMRRGKRTEEQSLIETSTDAKELSVYAHDASVFSITPEAVFYPRNVQQVVELVARCREEKMTNPNASLTVRAGGTCMSGGPLNDGWIVDMTRHMHAISIDKKHKTATVEMGAYFRDVEAAALKYGLMFPAYPSSRLLCGIGGMIGNNASGEKSIRYGATSDNVISLEVVLADGSIITVEKKDISEVRLSHEKQLLELAMRFGQSMKIAAGSVKKSASGYSLHKVIDGPTFNAIPVFVGAQGSLGIVTKATLSLVSRPKYLELLLISARTLNDVSPVIKTVFRYNPEGIETFDINTYKRAQEHLAVSAQKILPFIDPEGHLFILAQFSEATAGETRTQAEKCFAELVSSGYFVKHIDKDEDKNAVWDVRRNSFTLMRDYNKEGFKAVPCIEDVIVPLPNLGEFIKSLITILKKRKIHYGFHGHVGDGSLRIIPVFDFRSPKVADNIIDLMKDVFKLVKKLDGNTSADHSDGIIRTPFLRTFYGKDIYGAFEQVKMIYDKDCIMNPRKKVGGTIANLKKSMK